MPLQTMVDLNAEMRPREAELRDLSMTGAFVAADPVVLPAGSGLRLEFTLPQGFRVNVFGRIVWRREVPEGREPAGYGIRFHGLDDVNREFIQFYLELARRGEGSPIAGGKVETRFEVSERGQHELYIRLAGSLLPLEAESLEEVVCHKLSCLDRNQVFVYIDARDLGACSRLALDHVRKWFERLRQSHQLLGVLVGGTSIGVVQLRRLAREAAIADALVMFTETREAIEFWRTLVGSSFPGVAA